MEEKMDFYSNVKKLAKSSMITLAVIFGIFAAILLVVGFKGVVYQFSEPKNFNEEVFDGLEKGDYVKLELNMCFGLLGEYTSTNTDTGSTSVTGGLYLFAVSDEDFEKIKYVPVSISKSDAKLAEQIIAQTEDAFDMSTGEYNPGELSKCLEIEGVLKKMKDSKDYNEQGLYDEVVKAWKLTDAQTVDYLVQTETYTIIKLVAFVFGLLFLGALVLVVVLFAGPFSTKKLKAYVAKKGLTGREAMLSSEFDQGKKISKQIIAGREHLYFAKGLRVNMLSYADIVWAYVDVVKTKNSVAYKLNLIMRDKSRDSISATIKNQIDAICETILAVNPGILIGNDKEKAQMYRNNFDELVRMVDEKRTQTQFVEDTTQETTQDDNA